MSGRARITPPLSDIFLFQGRAKEIMLNVFFGDRASFYHIFGLIEHSLPSISLILVFLMYRLDAASYQNLIYDFVYLLPVLKLCDFSVLSKYEYK
jgi:hypothetical protein